MVYLLSQLKKEKIDLFLLYKFLDTGIKKRTILD
jgi:hypothetical protein